VIEVNNGEGFSILNTIGKFKMLKVKLILYGIVFLVILIIVILPSFFFFFDGDNDSSATETPYSHYEKGKGICGLIVPLKSSYSISSLYGYRVPKAQNGSSFHRGIDMAVSSGTNVYAATSGTVTVGNGPLVGHYLRIRNESGEVVKYYHLSKTLVSSGTTVKQGDLVAKSGNTGASSGPHLHFEFVDEKGKTVSLNNMFGYTDIPECINYTGSKPAEERQKCNKNSSRKMSDLEKTQFKNACDGITTSTVPNNEVEDTENNVNSNFQTE